MPVRFHDKDDKELLELYYSTQDTDVLGTLLQRYTALLLGVSMKYLKNEDDARDSVQQIFLKVINELQKYRVEYFKSWLYMIAKNHCLMKLRGSKHREVDLSGHDFKVSDDVEEISPAEKEKILTNMEKALSFLNDEQRSCVTLFYLDKKSYREVAEITGNTILQVKSNIQNGKRNLKIQMERIRGNE